MKDLFTQIIFLLVGAALGVFFDRIIYKIFEKRNFEKRLKDIVKEAKRDEIKKEITVKELNKLIDSRTYDNSDNSGDSLPFKACPKCGNKDLDGGSSDDGDHVCYVISCKKCGWSELTE